MSKELDARIALTGNWTGIRPSTFWGDHDLTGIPPGQLRTFVPRWSSDLNLMWELEEKLKQTDLFIAYAITLNREVLLALGEEDASTPGLDCDVVHATAEQKAIAYLKVKEGKQWKSKS